MSQHQKIIKAMTKYRWLDPLNALRLCGTMKLSTRIGELRRMGHVINADWLDLPSGKRVRKYRLVK